MRPPAPVRRTAFLLGFAGLLPQAAAVAAAAGSARGIVRESVDLVGIAAAVGTAYPLIILSFLGGIWWGFAMHRDDRQGRLAALAVGPSLVALALLALLVIGGRLGWSLVTIGCAMMLTLPVDRALVANGDAPVNWMRLRVPLSLGLGALTILLGAIVGDFDGSI